MKFSTLLQFARNHKIPIHPKRRYVGIYFTLFAYFLLAFSTVLFQDSSKNSPVFVNYFFQFLTLFVILLIFSLPRGLKFFKANAPNLVILRGVIAVITYYVYFLSKIWVSAVDNSMLFSTDALLIPLILLMFLKQKIHLFQWFGIIIGFFGIGFVYVFDFNFSNLRGLAAGASGLFSGVGVSLIVIISSYIVKNDPPLRIALYQSIIGVITSGLIAIFQWETPSLKDLLLMIYAGGFFAVALFLFLDSLYYTEPYIIGVLGYSLVLFVESIDWILHQYPTPYTTIVGSSLITIGGLITIFFAYYTDKKKNALSTTSSIN